MIEILAIKSIDNVHNYYDTNYDSFPKNNIVSGN